MKNFQDNQSNASNADLQRKSPLDYAEGAFKGGISQSTASEAGISHSPYNLFPINPGTGTPLQQSTASSAPLDRSPRHGWTSNPGSTTPSDRSIKQSK